MDNNPQNNPQNIQNIPKDDPTFVPNDEKELVKMENGEVYLREKVREVKPPAPTITLTTEQQHAIETIVAWMEIPADESPEYKLGGYAGTGKTTVLKTLIAELRKKYCIVPCSFTGKAVDVLCRKGVPACTMHSLFYHVEPLGKGRVQFVKKSSLKDEPDLLIVDEASMVSTELYNDARSFGLKYLFVGDPGQLEPVGENPNLMKEPDFVLTQIHRQAAQSPIITLAHQVRQGARIGPGIQSEQLVTRTKGSFNLAEVQQIICARNNTRKNVNQKARILLEHVTKGPLVVGEKIIVLRNNRDFGVFNGMIMFVKEILQTNNEKGYWLINAEDEIGRKFEELPIWHAPFVDPTFTGKDPIIPRVPLNGNSSDKVRLVYCDYAYCITCHKSQGSEWDHVLVLDEWMPPEVWDMKRWRYTAITRAAKKLTYCV